MKKRTPVSQIMTKNPITVNETNSVTDVVDIFKKNPIHHLPVVSGNTLIGIISKTDVERISFVADSTTDKAQTSIYHNLSISQIMTRQPETVQADETIKEAAEILATGSLHALPVVEKDQVQGIVTSTDMIKYLIEQY